MQDKKQKRFGIYLYEMEIQKTQKRWAMCIWDFRYVIVKIKS